MPCDPERHSISLSGQMAEGHRSQYPRPMRSCSRSLPSLCCPPEESMSSGKTNGLIGGLQILQNDLRKLRIHVKGGKNVEFSHLLFVVFLTTVIFSHLKCFHYFKQTISSVFH